MIRTVTGSIIILLCMSLCCIYFYSEMPSQNLICGYITNEVTVSYDYNYSEPTVKEYKNVLYYCNKALTGFNLLGFVGKLLKRNQ